MIPAYKTSPTSYIIPEFITFCICDTQFACNAAAAKSSSLCLDIGEIKLRW
jgi:hypothetical protein